MTTNSILGTNEQTTDQAEYLMFAPNRIHDRNIGDFQMDQKIKPSDVSRNDMRGRPNLEL